MRTATLTRTVTDKGGQSVTFTQTLQINDNSPLDTTHYGAYNDGPWAGSRATSKYYQYNQSVLSTSQKNVVKALLDLGYIVNLTWTSKDNPGVPGDPNMPAKIIAGDAAAMTWVRNIVASCAELGTYAKNKNNGSAVLCSLFHEGTVQKNKNGIICTGTTMGQCQQIYGRELIAGAPDAYWLLWYAGFDRTFEGLQATACQNPRPHVQSTDPYSNGTTFQSLIQVAQADLLWMKSNDAYYPGQRFAITETGAATNRGYNEPTLASFYNDWRGKVAQMVAVVGVPLCEVVFFNSDGGDYPHVITQSAHPLAFGEIAASLTP